MIQTRSVRPLDSGCGLLVTLETKDFPMRLVTPDPDKVVALPRPSILISMEVAVSIEVNSQLVNCEPLIGIDLFTSPTKQLRIGVDLPPK